MELIQHLESLSQHFKRMLELLCQLKNELSERDDINQIGFQSKREFIQSLETKIMKIFEDWKSETDEAISSPDFRTSSEFRHTVAFMLGIGKDFDISLGWSSYKQQIKDCVGDIYSAAESSYSILAAES